jgi:hypothetical protein
MNFLERMVRRALGVPEATVDRLVPPRFASAAPAPADTLDVVPALEPGASAPPAAPLPSVGSSPGRSSVPAVQRFVTARSSEPADLPSLASGASVAPLVPPGEGLAGPIGERPATVIVSQLPAPRASHGEPPSVAPPSALPAPSLSSRPSRLPPPSPSPRSDAPRAAAPSPTITRRGEPPRLNDPGAPAPLPTRLDLPDRVRRDLDAPADPRDPRALALGDRPRLPPSPSLPEAAVTAPPRAALPRASRPAVAAPLVESSAPGAAADSPTPRAVEATISTTASALAAPALGAPALVAPALAASALAAPALAAPALTSDAPAPAPAAPTIRVSIGRIEIRATASGAAPSPAPPRPAGPRLSLDDYLRSRR